MAEPYLCGDTGVTPLSVLAGVDLPLEGCPSKAVGWSPDAAADMCKGSPDGAAPAAAVVTPPTPARALPEAPAPPAPPVARKFPAAPAPPAPAPTGIPLAALTGAGVALPTRDADVGADTTDGAPTGIPLAALTGAGVALPARARAPPAAVVATTARAVLEGHAEVMAGCDSAFLEVGVLASAVAAQLGADARAVEPEVARALSDFAATHAFLRTRCTEAAARKRHPRLGPELLRDLPFTRVLRPVRGGWVKVRTFLTEDVAQLAAREAWRARGLAVETRSVLDCDLSEGTRHTAATAVAKYPGLDARALDGLRHELARRATANPPGVCSFDRVYMGEDVDALAARLGLDTAAAPAEEPEDPVWVEVEAGARLTQAAVRERYPALGRPQREALFKELDFEFATKPRGRGQRVVKTYAAADVAREVERHAERALKLLDRLGETVAPRKRKRADLPAVRECPFCEAAGGAPDCSDCGVATIAASAASFS